MPQPDTANNVYSALTAGDPAPWFRQRNTSNPNYTFDTAAGRYIVMCFYLTAGDSIGQDALKAVATHRQLFDDNKISFFGISVDPNDESEGRVRESMPGIRLFWDFDHKVCRLYGALPTVQGADDTHLRARRFWLILDPNLRVVRSFPMLADGANVSEVFAFLAELAPVDNYTGAALTAPVLYLPRVFEPELCRHLIGLYEAEGGTESGFMREIGGKTVAVMDGDHKRRRDVHVTDEQIIAVIQRRVMRRIVPEIAKVHQFEATRMERYIVGCYTAEDGGHFNAHRDNTTKGTAHRRFAITINLNADFEGGELCFPEYGPRTYKPPIGGAVVFSCSLLHRVSRVTHGRRYAFLPFLYDEAAARLREQNNPYLDATLPVYSASAEGPA